MATDKSVRSSMDALLGSWDFAVHAHATEALIIKAARTDDVRHPDCLIIDRHLLRMSLEELIDGLREAGITAPVIVVMGSADEVRSFRTSDVKFLVKPYQPQELLTAVRDALDGFGSSGG